MRRTGFDRQPYLGFGGIVKANGSVVEVFRDGDSDPVLVADVAGLTTHRIRGTFADIIPLQEASGGVHLCAIVLHNNDVMAEEDLAHREFAEGEQDPLFTFEQGDFAVLYVSKDEMIHQTVGLWGFVTDLPE